MELKTKKGAKKLNNRALMIYAIGLVLEMGFRIYDTSVNSSSSSSSDSDSSSNSSNSDSNSESSDGTGNNNTILIILLVLILIIELFVMRCVIQLNRVINLLTNDQKLFILHINSAKII